MYFKQFYLGCLAHASYMIGSNGEAAVVDPRRDVDSYIDEARAQGLVIKHVIETHLHADFVSGHRELAHRTGAKIYFGAKAGAKFEHVPVREGDEIRMGDVVLRFLETPGHTPESVSILVIDRSVSDTPKAVLTGDTLFIGDVGRPDLLGARMSAQELAGMLYDSLHGKLLALPDSVEVYPAHGAGSLCGRNISSETSSTIGQQRRFNYALKPMPKEEFVRMMTTDLPEAPAYFSRDVAINRDGAPELAKLPDPAALQARDVDALRKKGAAVLDTRPAAQYGAGHIPGSLHIGLSGQFASWAGALISPQVPIVLVAEEEDQVREARTRLARVGIENVAGYLAGGILEWDRAGLPLATMEQMSVEELDARVREGRAKVVDVRRPGEWQAGHIAGALHVPLNTLADGAAALPKDEPLAVICAGGFRSSIATSVLEQQGFTKITNVVGGMAAWRNANLDVAA
ncbi:MAG TPA: rhodanese-like domain-containing protein [Thermoanaerobaculia bacterium]|nr:rhodanese-like domain-containing protein [Thermoanaerobaculia bacterium]